MGVALITAEVFAEVVPTLSVVVPVHNGAAFITETLFSIFGQSFSDFEVILVDDASQDDLPDVLTQFRDTRLRVERLDVNVGVAAARNRGVCLARGSYVAFCDADDVCLPDRFSTQLEYLRGHADIGVCGSAFICFDCRDRDTVQHPGSPQEIRKALMAGNCFGMSTIMGRTSVFKEHKFNQLLSLSEDYDLWTRITLSGVEMSNIPQSLVRYRLHSQQASRLKGELLDQQARKIRAMYCATLLGDRELIAHVCKESINLTDIVRAAEIIAMDYQRDSCISVRDFRFFLAWLYQKNNRHGWREWIRWCQIQHDLDLCLDKNYRFNIFILALLPRVITRRYFQTFIKLKR